MSSHLRQTDDEPRHSPAPWTVTAKNGWSVRSADQRTVALVVSQLPAETEANADVIAAGPKMLAIIKALASWYAESQDGRGPYAGSLLFEDDRPFEDHVKEALTQAEAYRRP